MPSRRHPTAYIVALGLGVCSPGQAQAAQAHKHPKAHHAHGKAAASAARPAAAAPKAVQPIEAVEAVEAVEPVEATETIEADTAERAGVPTASQAAPSWRARATLWLGHMHAAVVHLPIAWLLLWALFDLSGLWLGQAQLLPAAQWLGPLATLSWAPAVASGLLRFDELSQAAADAHTMDPALLHRNLMYVCLGLAALGLALRKKAVAAEARLWLWSYSLLLVSAVVVVAYAAHLGGALVYGDEFLQF